MWQKYQDDGLMVVTMLTQDAQNNVPDDEDCADWAEQFDTTHPILAEDKGFAWNTMMEGYGFPFYMLVDRGMVVHKIAEGEGSISEAEVVGLLAN